MRQIKVRYDPGSLPPPPPPPSTPLPPPPPSTPPSPPQATRHRFTLTVEVARDSGTYEHRRHVLLFVADDVAEGESPPVRETPAAITPSSPSFATMVVVASAEVVFKKLSPLSAVLSTTRQQGWPPVGEYTFLLNDINLSGLEGRASTKRIVHLSRNR